VFLALKIQHKPLHIEHLRSWRFENT